MDEKLNLSITELKEKCYKLIKKRIDLYEDIKISEDFLKEKGMHYTSKTELKQDISDDKIEIGYINDELLKIKNILLQKGLSNSDIEKIYEEAKQKQKTKN